MRLRALCTYLLLVLISCQAERHIEEPEYPEQLGSIAFNATTDNSDFKLCNEANLVHSRTSLSYEGGKAKIEALAREWFAKSGGINFSGFVSVHFLVNCQGLAGRVRIEAMDGSFVEKEAPKALIHLLRNMVLSLDKWVVTKPPNAGKDHSKYLIFKIVNGEIAGVTH